MEDKITLLRNHNRFKQVLNECQELRWKKLNDYGIIQDNFGGMGILVRMNDKLHRINNLYQNKKKPNFESIEDSIKDLINYSIMLLMELNLKRGGNNEK